MLIMCFIALKVRTGLQMVYGVMYLSQVYFFIEPLSINALFLILGQDLWESVSFLSTVLSHGV